MTLLSYPPHFDFNYLTQILLNEKENLKKKEIVENNGNFLKDSNPESRQENKNNNEIERDLGPANSVGYLMNNGRLCSKKEESNITSLPANSSIINTENSPRNEKEIRDNFHPANIANADSGFGSSSSSRFQDCRHFIALTRAGETNSTSFTSLPFVLLILR